SADAFRGGRSRLRADADAGVVLKGVDGTHTLVDMLAGSTYYTFVDSGAFTAEHSSMTNMDPEGFQLSGSAGVSITTSTFDYLGFASDINAYITARDLSSTAVFHGVTFGLSRSSHGFDSAYNVRVTGTDSSLDWTFRSLPVDAGALFGEDHDDDANAKVGWADTTCEQAFTSAQTGDWSQTSTWDQDFLPTACNAVTVSAAHTVTVDTTTATASTTTVQGVLKFSRVGQSSFTLVQGDLTVAAGGHLDMGTEADPIPSGTTAHLVLALGQTAGQYGLIVQDGGDFTVRGATKSPYGFALAGISAGGTALDIAASSATAWAVGDTFTIGPTTGTAPAATEERVITGISGGATLNITWSGGIANERTLTSTAPIVVANLTRNVLIRSSGTTVDGAGADSAYIRNLARNATSFSLAYGEFAYLGANASGKYGITFDGSDVRGSVSSCAVRGGYHGIYVDSSEDITLASNNVYSSDWDGIHLENVSHSTLSANSVHSCLDSGINLSASSGNVLSSNYSYSSDWEGIWLNASSDNALTDNHAYSNDDVGIYLESSSSSNTVTGNNIHYNHYGSLYLENSPYNTLSSNISHSNLTDGIKLNSSSDVTLSSNTAYLNSGDGIALVTSSRVRVTSNTAHSNENDGIEIGSSSEVTLTSNTVYRNASRGIWLNGGSKNTVAGNAAYDNDSGIGLGGSSNNTLDGNEVHSNTVYGIALGGSSDDNTFVSNDVHDNSGSGIAAFDSDGNAFASNDVYSNSFEGFWSSGTSNNTLVSNRFYSNSRYGLYLEGSSSNTFVGGGLGYDQTGSPAANTAAELYFNASKSEDLILKAARINPAVGISTAGFNREGNYLLSYNQDFDTGTVRVWGDYPLLGSTLTLDYSAQLHASTATTPKLMRGTGHSISIGSTHDAYALS
ncbi:MAG: right-handed parallel beta-helix repeat-containing protein, partial [Elusimicrobiota bacterium]